MTQMRKPAHPGAFFKRTILDKRGISVTEAAKLLGVSRKTLSGFINEKSMCSHSMAKRLAVSVGTGVGVWINMQANFDTWIAETMDEPENIQMFPTEKVA